MIASESSVFSPGDSEGINANVHRGTTTTIERVPQLQLPKPTKQNLIVAAIVAIIILWLVDRARRRGRRR